MTRDQFAINSVSTSGESLVERLDAYAAAGFRKVEFRLRHVKDELERGLSVSGARRMLDERGLACIGGFEHTTECFSAPDSRAVNAGRLTENARLLAELGARTMVVGTDGPAEGETCADPLGVIASALGDVADDIRETGVTLCIEFNWSPVVKSLRGAVEVARRCGRENVGVLFDPAHYYCTPSKFEQLTPEAVSFIRHVHVDDMRDKPPELCHCNADRVLPGEGCLDLQALVGRIEAYGYAGDYAIEMFSEELRALPPREAADRMYASLVALAGDGP